MAVATYATDLIVLDDCSGGNTGYNEPSATGWEQLNAETFDETDLYIQNIQCISATAKTGVGATLFDNVTGVTMPTDGAFLIWMYWSAPNSLDTEINGGIRTIVGSTTADFNAWIHGGSDSYVYGGWLNLATNPTAPADYTEGTPGTTYQHFGWAYNALTVPSKGNPYVVDAMRYGRCEISAIDGDLANGYANFADMAAKNDANDLTEGYNRWGLFQALSGPNYLWKGMMSVGLTATATDFRDSNVNITIDDTKNVTPNFNKIEINNSASNVVWTNINIAALGTIARGNFEVIDDAIVLKDTCNFVDMGSFVYLTNSTLNNCTYRRCDAVTQNGATFTGCTFVDHQASTGSPATIDAALLVDDLTLIADCNFIGGLAGSPAGVGHAIEITSAAAVGSPTSFDLTGNTFTNFGADGTTDAAIYNNSGTQIILNILSGDTPTILNGTGSSTIINNSVTILVLGVTEGAAVKVIANETVGTITLGDVILEVLADSNGEASTSINYEGAFEPSGLDVITRVRSSGLPTSAIQDDNGAFTDETTAANSAVVADMHLLPTTPVVNEDRYLFGHAEMFNNMKIGINTAGTGGFTITWQYWNGAWTNLTGVVDDTSSFSVAGTNYVSFTMPGDWVTTTINSQGPYYYIRAVYTAGTVTVVPLGTRCSLDVNKYLPFVQDGTVLSTGLTITASWNEDTIATF